jgi:hypothetical protein
VFLWCNVVLFLVVFAQIESIMAEVGDDVLRTVQYDKELVRAVVDGLMQRLRTRPKRHN